MLVGSPQQSQVLPISSRSTGIPRAGGQAGDAAKVGRAGLRSTGPASYLLASGGAKGVSKTGTVSEALPTRRRGRKFLGVGVARVRKRGVEPAGRPNPR